MTRQSPGKYIAAEAVAHVLDRQVERLGQLCGKCANGEFGVLMRYVENLIADDHRRGNGLRITSGLFPDDLPVGGAHVAGVREQQLGR